MNSSTHPELTAAERAVFAIVLGILWASMVIQDTGLADRWDTTAQVLDVVIVVVSVGIWWCWLKYGLPFFGRR